MNMNNSIVKTSVRDQIFNQQLHRVSPTYNHKFPSGLESVYTLSLGNYSKPGISPAFWEFNISTTIGRSEKIILTIKTIQDIDGLIKVLIIENEGNLIEDKISPKGNLKRGQKFSITILNTSYNELNFEYKIIHYIDENINKSIETWKAEIINNLQLEHDLFPEYLEIKTKTNIYHKHSQVARLFALPELISNYKDYILSGTVAGYWGVTAKLLAYSVQNKKMSMTEISDLSKFSALQLGEIMLVLSDELNTPMYRDFVINNASSEVKKALKLPVDADADILDVDADILDVDADADILDVDVDVDVDVDADVDILNPENTENPENPENTENTENTENPENKFKGRKR